MEFLNASWMLGNIRVPKIVYLSCIDAPFTLLKEIVLIFFYTYDINDKLYKSIIEILKRKKNQYYNHRYHYHHFR